MATVAELILKRLDAIETRLQRIEENQEASWLQEQVDEIKGLPEVPCSTATVSVSRSPHKRHLPPKVARQLKDDKDLAENTRKTYENKLNRLLENADIIPVLVEQRNKGVPYKTLAEKSRQLFGTYYSSKTLSGFLSVGLRYQLIERNGKGQYQPGEVVKA